MRKIIIALLIGISGVLWQPGFLRATDAELEDILEGFEEEDEAEAMDAGLQDILGGFEDEEGDIEGAEDRKSAETPQSFEDVHSSSPFRVGGFFKLKTSYNFAHEDAETNIGDWQGFSRLRPELQLELSANLTKSWQAFISGKASHDLVYQLKGDDEFTPQVLKEYETDLELRQAYILGSLTNSFDTKVGRQIVVWGKSDNIRVADVLNPLDVRELGMTDLVDLRLPVAMAKLDYYWGAWNLSGIVIPEIRFNKTAVYGSDFYPGDASPFDEEIPGHGGENTEFAASLNGIFRGWDLALYWADIYDDAPHAELLTPLQPGQTEPQIALKHARLTMFGTAVNAVKGNWIFKAEAAYFDGLEFFNSPDKEYSRTDLLAGFEYSGFKDTTLSLEVGNKHIHDFDWALEQGPDSAQRNEFQSALRISRSFLNQSLNLSLLASTFGEYAQGGAFQRLSAEYDLNDNWQMTGGVVLYQSGDWARFQNIGDNDRLYVDVKYSF